MTMKKSYLIAIVIFGVAAVSLVAALAWPRSATAPQPGAPLNEGMQALTGKIICLPHKNMNGPHTLECALGLEAKDGKKYGIKDANMRFDVGDEVVAKGVLSAPAANDIYDITATINNAEVTVRN